MNAPARIDHPQRSKGTAWERYLPTLAALRPCGDDDEARQRAGLLLMRDIATERQRDASEPAGMVFAVIEEIAARTALGSFSTEQLDTIRLALVRLGTGARELEKVFGGDG